MLNINVLALKLVNIKLNLGNFIINSEHSLFKLLAIIILKIFNLQFKSSSMNSLMNLEKSYVNVDSP